MDFNSRVKQAVEPELEEIRRLFLANEPQSQDLSEVLALLRAIKDQLTKENQKDDEPDSDDDHSLDPFDILDALNELRKRIRQYMLRRYGKPPMEYGPDAIPYDGQPQLPSNDVSPDSGPIEIPDIDMPALPSPVPQPVIPVPTVPSTIPQPMYLPSVWEDGSSVNSGAPQSLLDCCAKLTSLIQTIDERTCNMQSFNYQNAQMHGAQIATGSGGGFDPSTMIAQMQIICANMHRRFPSN